MLTKFEPQSERDKRLRGEFLQELEWGKTMNENKKPEEYEILAMEEFIKTHVDIVKSKIRQTKASSNKSKLDFATNEIRTLTINKIKKAYIKKEVPKYSKVKFTSAYVGKRGDVIVTFDYLPEEIVEMKLREAIELLNGFWACIEVLLHESFVEMSEHFKALEIQRKAEKEAALLKEQQEAAEKKAAKYKGKPLGIW